MNFVQSSNLPQNEVTTVFVSDMDKGTISTLEVMGIKTITPPIAKYLPKAINYHADMSLVHLGDNVVLCSEFNADFHEYLMACKVSPTYLLDKLGQTYPYDVLLNVCFLGNKLICNSKTCDASIVTYARNKGYEVIDVNQGYTKCSIAVVDENSIITSDKGIAKECEKYDIHCLLITPGQIELEGYEYGFIGGCCGKIAKDKLFFAGDISLHSDADKINEFLRSKNVKPICIKNKQLVDIGGILPIVER